MSGIQDLRNNLLTGDKIYIHIYKLFKCEMSQLAHFYVHKKIKEANIMHKS